MTTATAHRTTLPDISPKGDSLPDVANLPIYFEDAKSYLVYNGERYVTLSETSVRRWLRDQGFPAKPEESGELSAVDSALLKIQMTKVVAYSGPLAGKKAGIYTFNNNTVLVTGGPTIIEPNPAIKWDFIREIIEPMFGPIQLVYLYGWLKIGYNALRRGTITPGQALALVGPRDCGKTLVQSILAVCLGDRVADPYDYMMGATPFNRDLFAAEFLMFGDQIASTDIRARRTFGSRIKQITVNQDQRCHGKGRDGFNMRPFWRICMSLNDEPENVMVLPPLDSSIKDKIILLKADRPPLLGTPRWSTDRDVNWARIMDEMPGFLAHVSSFEIPTALAGGRFGISEYHDPDILLGLDELSPERRLLELVDMEVFKFSMDLNDPRDPWEGPAIRLEQRLRDEDSQVRRQADQLLAWQGATGTFLGRLCSLYPRRVTRCMLHGNHRYTIKPPALPPPLKFAPIRQEVEGCGFNVFSKTKVDEEKREKVDNPGHPPPTPRIRRPAASRRAPKSAPPTGVDSPSPDSVAPATPEAAQPGQTKPN